MSDTQGVTTRSSNASKHPGAVTKGRKRRSPEEVAQEKALKWAAAEKKKAQKEKATLDIATLEAVLRAGDGKREQERQVKPTSAVTGGESKVPLYDEDSPADGNGDQLQSISDLADGDDGGAVTDHASIDEPPKKKVKANKSSTVMRKDEGTGASGKGKGTRREAIEAMGKKLDAKVRSYSYHRVRIRD